MITQKVLDQQPIISKALPLLGHTEQEIPLVIERQKVTEILKLSDGVLS